MNWKFDSPVAQHETHLAHRAEFPDRLLRGLERCSKISANALLVVPRSSASFLSLHDLKMLRKDAAAWPSQEDDGYSRLTDMS